MKKSPRKTVARRTTYSLDQVDRPHAVQLSEGEIYELANRHIATAKAIPSKFGKWLARNPNASLRDLKEAKELMLRLSDFHHDRASELIKLVAGR